MDAIITALQTVLSAFLSCMTSIVTWVTETPIVLIFVLLAIIFIAFSAVSRAVRGF